MNWIRNINVTTEQVVRLSKKFHIDPLLLRIILNRGFNEQQISIMNNKDDLEKAVPVIPLIKNDLELNIDETVFLSSFNKNTFNIINRISYNDKFLTEPVFAILNVEILGYKLSKNRPNNICFRVKDGNVVRDIWAWNMANKYDQIDRPNKMDIAGNLEENFMRPNTFTMKIIDFKK